ncbi:MAG: hypothetical protein Q9187_003595, partial [Circinaria calcarea]
MSFSPIGDVLALANLACKLYNKGYLVIRDAPSEFRSLLRQLAISRRLICHVGSKVDQHEASLSGEVLARCFQTLDEFEVLLAKYEKLVAGVQALTDRNHWLRRAQWATQQNTISACRQKVNADQTQLMLALYSERGYVPESQRILNDNRLQEWMAERLTPDTSTLVASVSPHPHQTRPSVSTAISTSSTGRRPSPPPLVEASETSSAKGLSRQRMMAAVDVEEFLRRRRTPKIHKVQTLQAKHDKSTIALSSRILQAFHDSLGQANNEMKTVSTDVEVWITIATWWLLKVTLASRKTSSRAIWIFEEVVLEKAQLELLDNRVMKLVRDLSMALKMDLNQERTRSLITSIENDQTILGQDLHFLESFHQPIEAQSSAILPPAGDTTGFPKAIQEILGHPPTITINEVLDSSTDLDEFSLAMEGVMSTPSVDDFLEAQRWFAIDNAD